MLTKEKAKEALDELLQANRGSKAQHDSYWTLAMVYDHGPQWAYARRSQGNLILRRLRHIVDPQRTNLRVSMNMIHQNTQRIAAGTNPQRIRAESLIKGEASGNIQFANSCDALLQTHINDIHGLKVLRHANRNRATLGTGIVRRTMSPKGKSIPARKKGKHMVAWRTNSLRWESIFPWEIMRDPVATTTDPGENESIYCHYKPRSTDWVKRHFGITVKSDTTLGQLYSTQHQMQAATNWRVAPAMSQSKKKGVMVYETYFKDPEMENPWPWVLFAVGYTANTHRELDVVHFGPSSFYGLPFHHTVYDPLIQVPWGAGIPHLLMASQDITNVAFTWLVRIMQEGSGKWMFEEGTIIGDPKKVFSNRLDEVIQIRRNPGLRELMQPQRVDPPRINPAATQLLNNTPQWMKDQLNLADVQFGKSSKRGEAGKALELKLDAAEIPVEDVRRADELIYNELLFGTLVDVMRHYRLDQMRQLLGGMIPDEQIRAIKREDPTKVLSGISVSPATLRPRTPTQTKDEFITMAEAQIIDAEAAQWEMLLQGNVRVNTPMAEAYHKQMAEVAQMKAGQQIEVDIGDEHHWHIKTVKHVTNSQEYSAISPDARDALRKHLVAHMVAEQDVLNFGMAPEPTETMQQGSPPAEAMAGAAGIAGEQVPAAITAVA